MPRRELTKSELEKLPFCSHDWYKQHCSYEVDEGHVPNLQDCYDCLFERFMHALDDERISHAQHLLETLRKMIKEPST